MGSRAFGRGEKIVRRREARPEQVRDDICLANNLIFTETREKYDVEMEATGVDWRPDDAMAWLVTPGGTMSGDG